MKQMQTLRHRIRLYKNDLVSGYFHFRINTLADPYTILGRAQPYKILFILSHMRSGSSLLTHLLNSNSEIIGYGETHIQYDSEQDLKNLFLKVYLHSREFNKLEDLNKLQMNHTYVLDKVLHDNKFLTEDFLKSQQIYALFLLREPQRSLASIMDLKPHWDEETAYHYYIKRLSSLVSYAQLINSKKRSMFLTYEQLLNHTDSVFMALKQVLETRENFSEQYEVLRTTGMPNVGDHKGNIKAGRIIRNQRKLENIISSELIDKARLHFDKCSETLSEYCSTINNKL
ncbi:sulfotransferase family protein [Coleofasciculus sp. G2-EDA-02]|uniref:sulfotransferase family protein n=1 Tax=Coleofasciculus sp. G2-EDA-02 TaxID=3069529 RepID=UPI0032FA8147